jgi:hypothetical protein
MEDIEMGAFYILGLLAVGVIATWLFCVLCGINPHDNKQEAMSTRCSNERLTRNHKRRYDRDRKQVGDL